MPEADAAPAATDDPVGAWPVQRFCRQFLQVESELDFPDGPSLRQHAVQEYLYERLFAPDAHAQDCLGPEAGPPAAHTLRTLKTLVHKIEDSIDDWDRHGVSDNLVTRLYELASSSSSSSVSAACVPGTLAVNKNTVVYALSALERAAPGATAPPTVTILENRATLATGGTTGLRTWEAALHLGQYLCQHRAVVAGRRVLELGAGTGYVSILCAKHLQAAHCIATDGTAAVVDNLQANLRINGLDAGTAVSPRTLWWGDEEDGRGIDVDVVLGADITFDERDMPALLATIRQCVASNRAVTVLIAATERNRKTFEAFVQLAQPAFAVDMLDFPVPPRAHQAGPFYSDAVPIHICQLRPHSD